MDRWRIAAARTWNMHPDELYGEPWQPYMLDDLAALLLIEREEQIEMLKAMWGG